MTSSTQSPIMKDSQSSEKFHLPKNKIDPIPRHAIPAVSSPRDLVLLLKADTKVKNLILNKKLSRDQLSTCMSFSESLAQLQKFARTSGSVQGIEVDLDNKEDVRSLLKIQNKMRYLQGLKIKRGVLTDADTKRNLQRFLLRPKWIKAYSSTQEAAIPSKDAMKTKEKANVALELRNKSENSLQLNKPEEPFHFNKPQRLIAALGKRFLCLASLRDERDSFSFAITCYYDKKKGKYEKNVSILIRRLISGNRFEEIRIPDHLEDEVYKLLPLLQEMNIDVRTQLDLGSFSRENNKKVMENFLSREGARLVIWPSSFSSLNLVEIVTFSQEMYFKHRSYLCLAHFTFCFDSLLEEVKPALINYFTNMDIEWEQLNCKFKTNPTDWFNKEKRLWLTKMLDEMCEEQNKCKYSQINFEIELRDDFSADLYANIVEEIKLVIQCFAQRLQEKKIILTLNDQVKDEKNLLLFLKSLKNNSLNPLDLLIFKSDLPKTRELMNQLEKLKTSKELINCTNKLDHLNTQIKEIEDWMKKTMKLYDDVNKLKQPGCCLSFQNPGEDRVWGVVDLAETRSSNGGNLEKRLRDKHS